MTEPQQTAWKIADAWEEFVAEWDRELDIADARSEKVLEMMKEAFYAGADAVLNHQADELGELLKETIAQLDDDIRKLKR